MKTSLVHLATAVLALSVSFAVETATPANNDAGTNTGGAATKRKGDLLHEPTYDECMASGNPVVTRKEIYHEGWIDLNKNGKKDVYEDPAAPVEARLDDLISQMNVDEKTAQMATLYGYNRVAKDYLPTKKWFTEIWKDGIANIDEHLNGYPYGDQDLPGVEFLWPASKHTWALNEVQRFFIEDTRLGVPAEFTDEGLRGVEHFKATCFPTQLALGQSWNRKLLGDIAGVAAREALALGYGNMYSPIMDVMRDPRWGRCEESYGEDPYLVAELGEQVVKAIQNEGVVSTVKHFCIYANNKGAREGYARTDPRISLREAEMLHIWPFEHVIREANPLGVMASYNDYDGIPIQGSHYYLTELLRERLGFKGYVVSDSDAVEYINKKHKVAKDYKEGVRQAVMAGLNVRTTFTPPHVFVNPLRELVNEGSIPMEVIDSRVRDVLRVKMWEGLFDKPYKPLDKVDGIILNDEHLAISRQASRESLVLLKNENNLLPLDASKVKTIAVSGPNADNQNYALGRYGPGQAEIITVLKALETRFAGKAEILHSQGADFFDSRWPETEIMWEPPMPDEQKMIDAAVEDAKKADIAIVVVGDQPRGKPQIRSTVGENSSRTGISLTGYQDDLIRAVHAVGKPTIVVHISGRPNALNWADRLCPVILQAFFPGMDGGTAIVDTIFGDYTPGGKLTCTFPKTSGQIELNFPSKPSANAEQDKDDKVSVTGVLWPFGHGLSYTTFEYSDLKISPTEQSADGEVTVSFKITNTGGREGDEVPLLFIHDEVSSVTTWEKRLAGFDRIHLEKGESKEVSMTIEPESLMLWNREM